MSGPTADYWKRWIRAALVRALKTFAQTLAASLGVASTLTDAPWGYAFAAAGMAAVLSILTSLGGLPEVPEPTPGLFEAGEVVEDDQSE